MQLASYVGGAGGLAAVALLALVGALRLAGRPAAPRDLPVLGLGLFFLALTQYPFPDPARMTCPMPMTAPRVDLFHTLHWVGYFAHRHPDRLLTEPASLAVAMNYLLCAAIGLAAAAQGRIGWRGAGAWALGLPLAVELTQLTGSWGIFPCAYRQFDVDDIVLNGLGLISGYGVGRRIWPRIWRRSGAAQPAETPRS